MAVAPDGGVGVEMDASVEALLRTLTPEQRRALATALNPVEHVAVIGMACRFPGDADSGETFWDLLADGRDAVREAPRNRWDRLYDSRPGGPGCRHVRRGGYLPDVDGFDAAFFSISDREAATMDPKQRLLLEVVWEALEHAGQASDRLSGSLTGVFVGIRGDDHTDRELRAADPTGDRYTRTGMATAVAAGLLSQVLDLRGPSVAVDSACSSSLVAVHNARQSLLAGDCDLALAGGVHLLLGPERTAYFSDARLLSGDDRVRAFDADADGFVRSDGCGIVVLKRLSDALRDGDRVLAVLAGSAINHNGAGDDLAAPNLDAQTALLSRALEMSGIAADQVGLVEAHGMGTLSGDATELEAIKAVYGGARADGRLCYVGAVKSNVGHMEAAAGIGGFIKAVLSLQYGIVPANLNFTRLNENVSLDGTSLVVPTEARPFPGTPGARHAAVSSFGFGGTNAHVLLAEAPAGTGIAPDAAPDPAPSAHLLLPLSAATPAALVDQVRNHRDFLTGSGADHRWRDICATAGTRRAHHRHRLAVVASDAASAVSLLDGWLHTSADRPADDAAADPTAARLPRTGLFFPDPTRFAADLLRLANALVADEPVFGASFHRCLGAVPAGPGAGGALGRLFAAQVALAELWLSWGVRPHALLAEGNGRLAAAYVAGTLSLTDAARMIADGAYSRPGDAGDAGYLEYDAATGPDAAGAAGGCTELLGVHAAGALRRLTDGTADDSVMPATPPAGDVVRTRLLHILAGLYTRGTGVDWAAVHGAARGGVPLPTYPFQRRRRRLDGSSAPAPGEASPPEDHPLLGASVPASIGDRMWQTHLGRSPERYLSEYRVHGVAVAPAALYLGLALAAAIHLPDAAEVDAEAPPRTWPAAVELSEVRLERTLVVDEDRPREVRTLLTARNHCDGSFTVRSRRPGDRRDSAWIAHAYGRARLVDAADGESEPGIPVHQLVDDVRAQPIEADDLHRRLAEHGVGFGPSFQALDRIWRTPAGLLGRLRVPGPSHPGGLHPAIVDACLQVFTAAVFDRLRGAVIPVAVDLLRLRPAGLRPGVRPRWSHVPGTSTAPDGITSGDVLICDDHGDVLIEIRGIHARALTPTHLTHIGEAQGS